MAITVPLRWLKSDSVVLAVSSEDVYDLHEAELS